MITFFSTAKAFSGHSGIIQRNALQSWKLLEPSVEVILFGDEKGAAEVCAELDVRHEPHVERHESGMKYLNYMFRRAQEIAKHNILCYSNCDIVLLPDFRRAVEIVTSRRKKFLVVSQRWDTDVVDPIDFTKKSWADDIRRFAQTTGMQQLPHCIDFFVFPRGLYDVVPPLVVGRSYWDWWLVWKALATSAAVVDCSPTVVPIHQNHDHAYHPLGKEGTNRDELAQRNIALSGGMKHLKYILDATHKMDSSGKIRRVFFRRQYYEWKIAYKIQTVVNVTYPVRRLLGLRGERFNRALRRHI